MNGEIEKGRHGLGIALIKGGIATAILTLLFLYFVFNKTEMAILAMALPFFLLIYYCQFTIGRENIVISVNNWIRGSVVRSLVFPAVLMALYFIYLAINNQPLFTGNPWLLAWIGFLPPLVYAGSGRNGRNIGWLDFTLFVLMLLPSALIGVKQNSDIPVTGGGFDSMSHVMIILSGVYAFAIVRGLGDVGFVAEIRWKSLLTALGVWALYYATVFVFGRSVDFIAVAGYEESGSVLINTILFTMIGTFLHTALYEELFFRGILQNMLGKRIAQGKSWLVFWIPGLVILFAGAILVGYTLEGKMKWFPAFITLLMFAAAFLLEKKNFQAMGTYTSLAITGVTFGLVHYHAKSIIYIGLACLAGWAYGYTYIKTRNVFYSALVHMLVNTGVLIFGLKMIR